jgi:hypothetical protein
MTLVGTLDHGVFFGLWLAATLLAAVALVYCWRRFGPAD